MFCRFLLSAVLLFSACLLGTATLRGENKLEGPLAPFLGEARFEKQQVFKKERHPNIAVALDGTVLVTLGNSRLLVRRSSDGGKTFGPEIAIADPGIQSGGLTVDETTGDVLAFTEAKHPPAELSIYRSRDRGKTWKKQPTKIAPDTLGNTPSMHMNEHGITLRHGEHKGRLLRPARFYAEGNRPDQYANHYTTAIYSDDGGKSWQTSDPFPENGTGEATLAELSDGKIYYNSRCHWDQNPKSTRRRSAMSDDGGGSWSDFDVVEILPDGCQHTSYGCMGGLVRLPIAGRDILLFSNIDTEAEHRDRVTVWASFDGGTTWPLKRLIEPGRSAYSSLNAGRPGTPSEGWIYIHYEALSGSKLARFNLAWLLEGEPTGDGDVPAEFSRSAKP
ncbi:MAG: sialidase family protein [Pirellulales bacterium]|nr:sialidase family protein [Pirellulales bacterium]